MGSTELTCRELVELVTEYLEESLPPSERLRFESHLQDCPYCRTYLEQMRQTILLLGRIPEETIDSTMEDELLRRFHDWKQRPSP